MEYLFLKMIISNETFLRLSVLHDTIRLFLSHDQIEELTHWDADLGPAASSHYARGILSMSCLRSLRLDGVKLSDEFYSVMAEEASKSMVYP